MYYYEYTYYADQCYTDYDYGGDYAYSHGVGCDYACDYGKLCDYHEHGNCTHYDYPRYAYYYYDYYVGYYDDTRHDCWRCDSYAYDDDCTYFCHD